MGKSLRLPLGKPRGRCALPIKRREQRFAVSECQNSPRWDRHILEKDLFLTPSPVVNPQGYQTLDDSNTGLVSSESVSEEGAAPAGDCNTSGSMEPEVLQSSGAQLAFSPGGLLDLIVGPLVLHPMRGDWSQRHRMLPGVVIAILSKKEENYSKFLY